MPTLVEKHVANLLKEFGQIPGVERAFVCDSQGNVLGVYPPADAHAPEIQNAGVTIAQVLGAMLEQKGKPRETEIRFQHGIVFVRDLGNAFLGLTCAANVSWPILRMTLNVAASPFEKDQALQKLLAQNTRPAKPSR